jgi:hypothetical protein
LHAFGIYNPTRKTSDKGKLSERVGRKVTDLKPAPGAMVAGLPKIALPLRPILSDGPFVFHCEEEKMEQSVFHRCCQQIPHGQQPAEPTPPIPRSKPSSEIEDEAIAGPSFPSGLVLYFS